MLGIVDHFLALCFKESQSLANHVQVFFKTGANDIRHMEIPALAENHNHRGIGQQQGLNVAVLFGNNIATARAAKSRQLGMLQDDIPGPCEELKILGIRTGITGLDVIDAVLVKQLKNFQLVLDRKGDTLGLRAIAQRRIQNRYLVAHLIHPSGHSRQRGCACTQACLPT